jgi:hypothetical protein
MVVASIDTDLRTSNCIRWIILATGPVRHNENKGSAFDISFVACVHTNCGRIEQDSSYRRSFPVQGLFIELRKEIKLTFHTHLF